MIERILQVILIFVSAGIVCLPAAAMTETDLLLNRLDSVIDNRDVYFEKKQERLAELHGRLRQPLTDSERFDLLGELFDEYHSYNADSAYAVAGQRVELARKTGDNDMMQAALLNKANILSSVGMYHETLALIDSVRPSGLPDYLRPYYYHTLRTVYGYMAAFAAFSPEREYYERLTDGYRDSLLVENDPNSLVHILIKADQLNEHGKPQEAVELLETFMSGHDLTEHDRAICAWTLSEAYGKLGDTQNQKKHVLIASICDMQSAVLEYVALRQLALMLYKEGDLERAYRFLSIAVDDAARCNARQRIVELSDSYPTINGIYVEKVRSQKKALECAILVITVMAVALICMLVQMRKQMRRLAESRRSLEAANGELNRLNGRLTESNDRLNELNSQLKDSNERLNELNRQLTQSNAELHDAYSAIAEISELKEVYIGRYMDQSLAHIEMLDNYRKTIAKLVNSGKTDELKTLVKSTRMVDDELKRFYGQFDSTFLNLFPTFVEDLNNLLLPGEEIVPKKPGALTTELRIFALIRLGITDSDKIAKFLRYSLTTIYNYRTKVRNKARGDRSMLENEIAKIGRQDR